MLCSECGERPATVYIQRIINGEKTEMNLCPVCAAEAGAAGGHTGSSGSGDPFGGLPFEAKGSIHELLASLLPVPGRVGAHPRGDKVCPRCGLSYGEFARTGLLGCQRCYETFREMLVPVYRRVHGSERHRGRMPPALRAEQKLRRELGDLRARLQQAVAAERYEEAARLRDELRSRTEEAAAGEQADGSPGAEDPKE